MDEEERGVSGTGDSDGQGAAAKRRRPPRWNWEQQPDLWEAGLRPDGRCRLCKRKFITQGRWHRLGICTDCAEDIAEAIGALSVLPSGSRERRKAKADIPERMRWAVFKRDGFRCRHCGAQEMLRADHVEPESEGGPTTIENLQTLCHSCNARKGPRS